MCVSSSRSSEALSNVMGQSSGETDQLDFTVEEGFGVVQPFEETPAQQR